MHALSPFLCKGLILAVFQSSGIIPSFRDLVYRIRKYFAHHSAYCFRKALEMLSGPVDFLFYINVQQQIEHTFFWKHLLLGVTQHYSRQDSSETPLLKRRDQALGYRWRLRFFGPSHRIWNPDELCGYRYDFWHRGKYVCVQQRGTIKIQF